MLVATASSKGPFKNYVILLGGGGEVTKRLHKITRGEEGIHQKITLDYKGGVSIWFNPSIDKVSKKIQIILMKINFFTKNSNKKISP